MSEFGFALACPSAARTNADREWIVKQHFDTQIISEAPSGG